MKVFIADKFEQGGIDKLRKIGSELKHPRSVSGRTFAVATNSKN